MVRPRLAVGFVGWILCIVAVGIPIFYLEKALQTGWLDDYAFWIALILGTVLAFSIQHALDKYINK
jgi:hypothetical protein